ncbi:alpha/beta fold hydrolase [Gloeobacter violaceus]|uniref:Glr0796 protein n=1 Tax=Gloeobacter violaceus (strain ATCC 29082 / PCC 7421) TaxID=251221 RepID=Q7NMH0_GLOVI|nr:alpha/beta hydrolase [Gloeobacter violaceus]BAC88737.1 glr0796 [Gloeobacter violaceus PCC 7421]
MAYLDIDGTKHFYTLSGKPKPEQVPLVLVHGWCGSSRYWEPVAETWAERTVCLRYDLRGFGQSPLTPDSNQNFSLEAYSRELLALIDRLGFERIDLNAHSMGASIGLAFANLFPERVRKLVLTCTGVFQYEALLFETFYLASNVVIAVRPAWMVNFAVARKAFQRRFVYKLLEDRWARLFIEDYVVAHQAAARGTLYSSIGKHATYEMPDAFRKLAVPTLLISGEYDQIIPAAGAKRAVKVNPGLTLKIIPQTGHFPMLEAPGAYLESMNSFLESPGSGA